MVGEPDLDKDISSIVRRMQSFTKGRGPNDQAVLRMAHWCRHVLARCERDACTKKACGNCLPHVFLFPDDVRPKDVRILWDKLHRQGAGSKGSMRSDCSGFLPGPYSSTDQVGGCGCPERCSGLGSKRRYRIVHH